jgi:hypothetical protein
VSTGWRAASWRRCSATACGAAGALRRSMRVISVPAAERRSGAAGYAGKAQLRPRPRRVRRGMRSRVVFWGVWAGDVGDHQGSRGLHAGVGGPAARPPFGGRGSGTARRGASSTPRGRDQESQQSRRRSYRRPGVAVAEGRPRCRSTDASDWAARLLVISDIARPLAPRIHRAAHATRHSSGARAKLGITRVARAPGAACRRRHADHARRAAPRAGRVHVRDSTTRRRARLAVPWTLAS